MKFISWNVNGIRACVKKGFLDFFNEADADIFCIQESKMQEGQLDLELPGYHQYWNYAVKKGYSGTGIFTKEEPLSVSYGLGIEEHDQEGRVITLEFENYYFITVYTPNSQSELARLSYRMKWEEDFLAYLKKLEETKPVIFCGDLKESQPSLTQEAKPKKKPIIICGDFNVAATELDLKNPKNNVKNAGFTPEEREKFKTLLDSGFTDSYRYLHPDTEKYSWWSYRFKARERNAGWRIDYFLTSDSIKDKIKDAEILTDVMGSDHCPIELDIDI
ncbi:exodeoxyribonuclease III [Anaerostipes amylophilus]|jgi:exodeoxyribonuclease-3|uniref:Exodeoxyribonuclease III n=1 Tax=Anaerostipes amylophilus TaxID=2981779 RepID=A0ABV1IYG2_9FIRM